MKSRLFPSICRFNTPVTPSQSMTYLACSVQEDSSRSVTEIEPGCSSQEMALVLSRTSAPDAAACSVSHRSAVSHLRTAFPCLFRQPVIKGTTPDVQTALFKTKLPALIIREDHAPIFHRGTRCGQRHILSIVVPYQVHCFLDQNARTRFIAGKFMPFYQQDVKPFVSQYLCGGTSGNPFFPTSSVEAPSLPLAMADIMPAGPPPTTITSYMGRTPFF